MTIEKFTPQLLSIAPENPRIDDPNIEEIDALSEDIAARGLLNPLIGYKQGKRAMITAGGRRTRAIARLVQASEWNSETPVHVDIYPKAEAIALGISEQLSHEKLSELDELRVFTLPANKKFSDQEIAKKVGRSPIYVKRRRAILSLPENMVEAVFKKEISVAQAAALTLYANDEENLERGFNMAKQGREAAEIKDVYARSVPDWGTCRMAKGLKKEQYLAAGGAFQTDLFSDIVYILDYEILERLQHERQQRINAKKKKDFAFVEEVESCYQTNDFITYRGQCVSTPEEDDELEALNEKMYEGELTDEERERYHYLDKRQRTFEVPEEIKPHIGMIWHFVTWTGESVVRDSVLRSKTDEDKELLYSLGVLNRPETQGETSQDGQGSDDESQDPAISQVLQDLIDDVKVHGLRMAHVGDYRHCLNIYLHYKTGYQSWLNGHGTGAPFDPEMGMERSDFWSDTAGYYTASISVRGKEPVPDEKQGDVFTFITLQRLERSYVNGTNLSPEILRAHWTPTEKFLSKYKVPALLEMIEANDANMAKNLANAKKSSMVKWLAEHAKKDKEFVPLYF